MRAEKRSINPAPAPAGRRLLIAAGLSGVLFAAAPGAGAATVAYFTASGVTGLGNPQSWGGVNNTGQSVAFEVTIDFTSAVDTPTDPILLWEAGATGNGAALVLNGDNLHFFAGNGADDVTTGLHGLSASSNGVQIVSVFELNEASGNGTDEKLSIYVNADEKAFAFVDTANSWAGSDAGGLGIVQGGAGARYSSGTALFDISAVATYPESNISFAVYQLASSGGPADNTLANILVPEPSAPSLLGLAGLGLLRRRRR